MNQLLLRTLQGVPYYCLSSRGTCEHFQQRVRVEVRVSPRPQTHPLRVRDDVDVRKSEFRGEKLHWVANLSHQTPSLAQ